MLVECVPNISEGRERGKITTIVEAAAQASGARVLHVDANADANRTVVTMAGTVAAMEEASFRLVKRCAEVVDLRLHHGAHPRIGATDVCPFVPLHGVSMTQCVELSQRVARRVAEELGIPTYLYEFSAACEERRNLANIRRGNYEGLAARLRDARWRPDFGAAQFNARSGASVFGARNLLVAFNLNLSTDELQIAERIAVALRRKRRAERLGYKVIAWRMPAYGCTQLSTNITDVTTVGMHDILGWAEECAAHEGEHVVGSELVGLVPEAVLLAACRHYGFSQDDSGYDKLEQQFGLRLSDGSALRDRILERALGAIPAPG